MTKGIKAIREQIKTGGGFVNHEMGKQEKKVSHQLKKEVISDYYSSDEEDRIWSATSDSLSDVKGVISTLDDPEKDWSKITVDGKESNRNFTGWLDTVMKQYHKKQKDIDDVDLFGM